MKLEILMSTMNRQSIKELKLEEKNIYSNCLIINQITQENLPLINEKIDSKNIRMLSFRERGLSKSRNRALDNAEGEICIFSDDDVYYKQDFFNNVYEAFKKVNSDIITFKTITFESKHRKNYKKNKFKHNKLSILKVSSIEIAFKLDKILQKNIYFDEHFGLGTEFPLGEENIFLNDCLNKNIKVYFYPEINSIHSYYSSGNLNNNNFKENIIIAKGALAKRLYPKLYILIIIFLTFKLLIKYRKLNIFRVFNLLINGGKKIK